MSAAGESYVSEIADLALTGGVSYYIVIDGYGSYSGNYYLDIYEVTPPPPPPDCPGDSLFSQPPHGTADSWSAGTSEAVVDTSTYLRAESFSGVNNAICDVHWWGLSLYLSGSWMACTDSVGEAPW